jgi:hypothetical protein
MELCAWRNLMLFPSHGLIIFMQTTLMKRLLLPALMLLLPVFSMAQGQFWDRLSQDYVDDSTHDVVKCSYWQVLERGNLHRTMNTFYRISSINGNLYLDLKIIQGGDVFVVPRNGKFQLLLEDDNVVTLSNTEFKTTSKGAGARRWAGSGAEGIMLSFPISRDDAKLMVQNHVDRIRLYSVDGFVERRITDTHSELFRDEMRLVYYSR